MRLISHQALSQYIEFRNQSNESVGQGVSAILRKEKTKDGQRTSISTGVIAHLRRGAQAYCDPRVARAIEKHLNAPAGSLFLAEVIDDRTSGNRNGTKRNGSAA